ncbi:sigma-54 dependent transcriptional regulator, partial [bacterium]|nr:sigma-54 dependent transcriptional regulator [bacterium]
MTFEARSRILIVDTDVDFADSIRELLSEEEIEIDSARNSSEAFDELFRSPYDALLVNMTLGNESGLDILRELNLSGSLLPVIVMTSHASIETVAAATNLNAFDYITRPVDKTELFSVIRSALRSSRKASTDPRNQTSGKTAPIIGQSGAMVQVYKAVARVAQTSSTVLITGESGTGKELIARAIHDHSNRSRNSFIPINCGALSETLLESELFGHQKGAFTGANTAHVGIFESASGGTVFLDEVSETSAAFQIKLLRVLQEKTIKPVGSTKEKPVDVRIIAATNQTMEALMNSSFRKDLLY